MNHVGAFYSTRNSANGMLKEILGQKFSLIYMPHFARSTSFPGIAENAVPFATGNCQKMKCKKCKKFLVEWKMPTVYDVWDLILHTRIQNWRFLRLMD